jgi:hypothetical protein
VSEEEKDSFNLIDASADLIGSLTGASVAAFHNDVAGLLTGAAIGSGVAHTVRYGAKAFIDRVMGRREKARVGLVFGLAVHKIRERLENGEALRSDGFFDRDITDRSSADEVAEGILITAQTAYEERKLPYLANILAYVAFTTGVTPAIANRLTGLAQSLSYQQICLLALANSPERINIPMPGYPRGSGANTQALMILRDLFYLYQNGIVAFQGTFGAITRPPTDARAFPLQNLSLDRIGESLYVAMRLNDLPESDYAYIINALQTN